MRLSAFKKKKVFTSVLLVATSMMVSLGAMAENEGNAEAGKAKSAICAGCHGMDGNSVMPNFPKLAGLGGKYLIKQMQDIKSGARNVVEMTGMLTASSDQDIKDLAAYFQSQKITIGQAKPELVEPGESLYRVGNPATNTTACSACHGPAGQGVDLATFPALGGQHADYVAAQLRNFRSGARTNDGETRMMRSVSARLTDAEIEAVASYISGLHP